MARELQGKKVAILVENGFEQVELTEPRKALKEAGAETHIVSPVKDKVKGWKHTEWGDELPVDVRLEDARPNEYDALLLPGGVMNPDKLRLNEKAVRFVRAFFEAGKPVAAICHGPWMLVEADVVEGRRVTSYPSIKTDLKNAGADWVDEEVVTDQGLVTSRKPDDIPAFNEKMVDGSHEDWVPAPPGPWPPGIPVARIPVRQPVVRHIDLLEHRLARQVATRPPDHPLQREPLRRRGLHRPGQGIGQVDVHAPAGLDLDRTLCPLALHDRAVGRELTPRIRRYDLPRGLDRDDLGRLVLDLET